MSPFLAGELSPVPPPATAAGRMPVVLPRELWLEDLRQPARQGPSWLWHGLLAPGAVTLLTSQWKSGKTTLVSVLLARMKDGGQLAGRALAAGKAVVVSEESPEQWDRRSRRLGFGPHLCWLCRPFRAKPSRAEWLALVDRLGELRARHDLALAVIDPLAAFLPGRDESNAGLMLDALTPLQRLTGWGMSVLLLHHPGKAEAEAGKMARGSGALSGFADILLEMDWYARNDPDDRRRRLCGFSRYEETPRRLVIELNADGTDYSCLGDFAEAMADVTGQGVQLVLANAEWKLTRREILERWPEDLQQPDPGSLWRWLQRAVADGRLGQDGKGLRNDPFRYWLPGRRLEMWEDLPPLPPLEPLR